jgi:hypothetical protein
MIETSLRSRLVHICIKHSRATEAMLRGTTRSAKFLASKAYDLTVAATAEPKQIPPEKQN